MHGDMKEYKEQEQSERSEIDRDRTIDKQSRRKGKMYKKAEHRCLLVHLAFFSLSCLCLVQLLNCAAKLFKSLSHSLSNWAPKFSSTSSHFILLSLSLRLLTPYNHLSSSVCPCQTKLLTQGKVSICVTALYPLPSPYLQYLITVMSTSLKSV